MEVESTRDDIYVCGLCYLPFIRYKVIEKIEDNEIHSRFEEYLSSQEPLGQTQANLQWDYYARIVTEVCQIFGINKDNYEDEFELFYDYNLLEYFKEIIEDQAV